MGAWLGVVGLSLWRGRGHKGGMKCSNFLLLLCLVSMNMVVCEDGDEEYEEEEDYSGEYDDDDYSGGEEDGESGDYDYHYDYDREEGDGTSGDYYEYETK